LHESDFPDVLKNPPTAGFFSPSFLAASCAFFFRQAADCVFYPLLRRF
jgi:hypothetical protein